MFQWITGVIERLGYGGIAALMLLENLFPPIPSEVIVPLAGFIAAEGHLRLGFVIAAGSVGALGGSVFWYVVGRRIGERRLRTWVERHGKWLTLTSKDLDRASQWFARHGRTAVLLGRVVPGVRTFISLPAGFGRMPTGEYLLFSAIGTVAWTSALACAGVSLRASYTVVGSYLDMAANAVVVVLVAFLVRRYIRCWRASP